MKFNPLICPECFEVADGILERVTGRALLTYPDENGDVEYQGETKMFWEEQEPVCLVPGTVQLLCPNGHDWTAQDVTPEEEEVQS